MSIDGHNVRPRVLGEPDRSRFLPMAVLFVDPDRKSVEQLAESLRGERAVAVVGSVREATAVLRVRWPTLIVTELDLPDANGLDWIASLYKAPATHHLLLLVTTHRASMRDKIAAFQAGADDYLVKPIEPTVFVTHLRLLRRFRQVLGIT